MLSPEHKVLWSYIEFATYEVKGFVSLPLTYNETLTRNLPLRPEIIEQCFLVSYCIAWETMCEKILFGKVRKNI
jgi:hypothetical protein